MTEYVSRTLETHPDLLAIHARFPERYPYLLESVDQDSHRSWDILFAFPGKSVTLEADGKITNADAGNFLDALDQAYINEKPDAQRLPDLPFTGGWFIYLGYELAGEIEPRLHLPKDDRIPVAIMTRIPAAIVRERGGMTQIVAECGNEPLIEAIQNDIESMQRTWKEDLADRVPDLEIREDPPETFVRGVERIKSYIVEGDIFQVNLSRRWHARRNDQQPFDAPCLYRRLRTANPGPFNGLARIGDQTILSSSPERLVRCVGSHIDTRPIAGTRPRAPGQWKDDSLARELIGHPKERAEHIMLIDLERNDLGRVCQPGSIKVDELMVVVSYAHVHHIESNVSGTLKPGTRPGEIIRAVFPGGTITGCPKVRCMEIIAELEGIARGPYTGSIGYLDRNGNMDLNILIRTLVVGDETIEFRAGAGIVADSDPETELEETRAKAKGLLLSLKQMPH